jgi:hypothetical protein
MDTYPAGTAKQALMRIVNKRLGKTGATANGDGGPKKKRKKNNAA